MSRALLVVLVGGCGVPMTPPDAGRPEPEPGDAGLVADASVDAGFETDAGTFVDAGVVDAGGGDGGPSLPTDGGPLPCPTSGAGAIVTPGACFALRVVDTGLPGSDAGAAHYALEPAMPRKGALVVYLSSSIATPAMQIAEPQQNVYSAAAARGFHLISLVHENQQVLGVACRNAACYGATRKTVILGRYQQGAITGLRMIEEHQGVVARLEAALKTLAASRPGAGWDAFLSNPSAAEPSQRIDWSRVIAVGHSQGGGHAAYLGKLFPLRRVVQLSSTCDLDPNDLPAPWTAASEPWATSPATSFVGFAAMSGDSICPGHVAVWTNMGMAPERMHRDAATCGTRQTHNVTIDCVDNAARWGSLLE